MLLLATMAFGQAKEDAGDGKMLDKQTMEFKDYLPEIHGTIRGKYEYQTETSESRFEVRNARFSVSGNVHPIVAYKAEIDLSDEGSIKMLDAYARVFPVKDLNFTIGPSGNQKSRFVSDGMHHFLPANRFLLYKTGCHRCFQESVYCYSLC